MRIYVYLTTQFITTSSQLQDGLAITSFHKNISLLRFCGAEFINPNSYPTEFNQLQPKPQNGSAPMAANKWYMMQYELAYDPIIYSIPYQNIQLTWWLNYLDIAEIKMNSKSVGDIIGTIGTAGGATGTNPFNASNLNQIASKIILTQVGKNAVEGLQDKSLPEGNALHLPSSFFTKLLSSVREAATSSIKDIPKKAFSFISAILGGSSLSTPTPISMNLQVQTTTEGTISNRGSFPSSPVSMWVPGTSIPSNAVGIIPLYNKPLGVCNLSVQPEITIITNKRIYNEPDEPFNPEQMLTIEEASIVHEEKDFSSYLIINPELQKIADVTIEAQDIVNTGNGDGYNSGGFIYVPAHSLRYKLGVTFDPIYPPSNVKYYVRFTIRVKPHNGAPECILYKTFELKQNHKEIVKDETYYP